MPEHIQKTILSNGLTVISEFVPGVRSVSAGVWVKAGSRNETPESKGVAHFLEHMVFKGTEQFSALKIARSLEEAGGNINAYTSKELTVFYTHSLDIQLKTSIRVLADLVCRPLLTNEDIQTEKQVVLEEINAVKDTPEDYIFDVFQEELFPGQPLGYPILGTEASVPAFTRETVRAFWKQFYTPANMVLTVAGNLKHNRLVKWAESFFTSASTVSLPEPEPAHPVYHVHKKIKEPVNQCHLCLGTTAVSYLSDERYPLLALSTYLGGGMSSRLFQVIREKHGLAYSVYAYTEFYSDSGIIVFYLGSDENKALKAERLLRRELQRVLEKQISKAAVKRIQTQLIGNLFLNLESTERRMSRLAKNEIFYGRQLSDIELTERIKKINSENILETSQKIFNMDRFNTVSIFPNA